MKSKAHQIPATPVGELIAKGEVDIGFQEVPELLPIPGIIFVGKIPSDLELLTPFSAGVAKKSQHVEIAKKLILSGFSRSHQRDTGKRFRTPAEEKLKDSLCES